MEDSIKKEKEAQTALERAQADVREKRAAVEKLRAAQADVNRSADASEALEEAEKHAAATQKALKSAETMQTHSTKAYHDAAGTVESVSKRLQDLEDEYVPYQKKIDSIGAAVAEQRDLVKQLSSRSKELHVVLTAKEKASADINATVLKDADCIKRLQTDEGSLATLTLKFKAAQAKYIAANPGPEKHALLRPLWTLKDQQDHKTHDLFEVREDCAPKDRRDRDEPSLGGCERYTGGWCYILSCDASRHATCGEDHGCNCPAERCAENGRCVLRDPPVLLASPPVEPPAEPAAAGTVHPEGAVPLAVAAGLTMVLAYQVTRRRRAPEVSMPEDPLG